MDTLMEKGSTIIAIAPDDDAIRWAGKAPLAIDRRLIRQAKSHPFVSKRTLILGWNEKEDVLYRNWIITWHPVRNSLSCQI